MISQLAQDAQYTAAELGLRQRRSGSYELPAKVIPAKETPSTRPRSQLSTSHRPGSNQLTGFEEPSCQQSCPGCKLCAPGYILCRPNKPNKGRRYSKVLPNPQTYQAWTDKISTAQMYLPGMYPRKHRERSRTLDEVVSNTIQCFSKTSQHTIASASTTSLLSSLSHGHFEPSSANEHMAKRSLHHTETKYADDEQNFRKIHVKEIVIDEPDEETPLQPAFEFDTLIPSETFIRLGMRVPTAKEMECATAFRKKLQAMRGKYAWRDIPLSFFVDQELDDLDQEQEEQIEQEESSDFRKWVILFFPCLQSLFPNY
mmetsp:Transcript_19949/g.39172  ORF Transcript_19949/g.39172 Transcript_19949/m.39172 type:complete len:314 (-) Transcript_19949:132-1073(-)